MELFTGMGVFGALFVLFWAILSLFVPFLIWGIYNQSKRSRRELERLNAQIRALVKGVEGRSVVAARERADASLGVAGQEVNASQ